MCIGKFALYALDSRVAEVVIVIVTDDYNIHKRQVLYLAGRRRVPLQALDLNRGAAVLEYRVKEDAKTTGELDVVTGVA